ncbi:MAG: nucleoside-diphosphate-sugar epimerase [Chlamydiales bacterium]|jgi:nucleoside-diphosphate-sugar epimerase
MNIFLLGAGYVGMTLLSSWQNPRDLFTATTTSESKLREISTQRNSTKPLLLKIDQNSNIADQLDDFDVLIITIAPTSGTSYQETYLESSQAVKKSLEKRKKPLYLIYTSSTSVYGNQKGRTVSEDDTRNPASESSKILCEVENNYLSMPNKYITTCVLRLGGIYGPDRTLESRALKMSGKELPGTGEEPTNHSYLEDITSAIEYCISHKLSGTYNLVSDDHPSRKDLYDQLCKSLKVAPPLWKTSQNKTRTTNALVSNEKIKKAGFEFKQQLPLIK